MAYETTMKVLDTVKTVDIPAGRFFWYKTGSNSYNSVYLKTQSDTIWLFNDGLYKLNFEKSNLASDMFPESQLLDLLPILKILEDKLPKEVTNLADSPDGSLWVWPELLPQVSMKISDKVYRIHDSGLGHEETSEQYECVRITVEEFKRILAGEDLFSDLSTRRNNHNLKLQQVKQTNQAKEEPKVTDTLKSASDVKPGQLYRSDCKKVVVLGIEGHKICVLFNSDLGKLNPEQLIYDPFISNKYTPCTFDDFLDILQAHYGDKQPQKYTQTTRNKLEAGAWWTTIPYLLNGGQVFVKLANGDDLPLFNVVSGRKYEPLNHGPEFLTVQTSPLELLRVYRPSITVAKKSELELAAENLAKIPNYTWFTLDKEYKPTDFLSVYLKVGTGVISMNGGLSGWGNSDKIRPATYDEVMKNVDFWKRGTEKTPTGTLSSYKVGDLLYNSNKEICIKVDSDNVVFFQEDGKDRGKFETQKDYVWTHISQFNRASKAAQKEELASELPNNTLWYPTAITKFDPSSIRIKLNDGQSIYQSKIKVSQDSAARRLTQEEVTLYIQWYKKIVKNVERPAWGLFGKYQLGDMVVGVNGEYIITGPSHVITLSNQKECSSMCTTMYKYQWVGKAQKAVPEKSVEPTTAIAKTEEVKPSIVPPRKTWAIFRLWG